MAQILDTLLTAPPPSRTSCLSLTGPTSSRSVTPLVLRATTDDPVGAWGASVASLSDLGLLVAMRKKDNKFFCGQERLAAGPGEDLLHGRQAHSVSIRARRRTSGARTPGAWQRMKEPRSELGRQTGGSLTTASCSTAATLAATCESRDRETGRAPFFCILLAAAQASAPGPLNTIRIGPPFGRCRTIKCSGSCRFATLRPCVSLISTFLPSGAVAS